MQALPFLLVTDLDNTLVGDKTALVLLNDYLNHHRLTYGSRIVYSTGRSPYSYQQLKTEQPLLTPDALVTGVGTAIFYGTEADPDPVWSEKLSQGWDRDEVVAIATKFADLLPQPTSEQGAFKVSYFLAEAVSADVLLELDTVLQRTGIQANIVYSSGKDLDILAAAADKGSAMQYLCQKWQFEPHRTIACGDSGNDLALFANGDHHGIIVGNARSELLAWHSANLSSKRYLAKTFCAAGILEGLQHFGFL
jgi:sucrose-6-phosphatase